VIVSDRPILKWQHSILRAEHQRSILRAEHRHVAENTHSSSVGQDWTTTQTSNFRTSVEIAYIAFGDFQSEEWPVNMIELHADWFLANDNVQAVQ
jgi:hypothetical protein